MSDSELNSNINTLLMNQVLPFLSNNDDVITRVLNRSFEETSSPYKEVISDEGKKSLKTMKFKESKKLNNTCPIFQEDFEDDDLVTELPCGHLFIPYAISRWLEKENCVCPVCRFKFDSVEKRAPPRVTPRRRINRPSESATATNQGELQHLITTQPRRRQLPSYVRPPSPPIFYDDTLDYRPELVTPLIPRHRILPEIPREYPELQRRPLIMPSPTRHLNYRDTNPIITSPNNQLLPPIRNPRVNRFRMFQRTNLDQIPRTREQREVQNALRRTRR